MVAAGKVHQSTQLKRREQIPSLTEIKQKLPAHCFKSNSWLSVKYLLRDLALFTLLLLATGACYSYLSAVWNAVLLPLLIFAQGTIMWALFVIGHDAGHGSFSNSRALNLAAGLVSHSILLVPFAAWQLSHRKHHKNTGNLENDEVFVPVRQRNHRPHNDVFPRNHYFGGLSWFLYLMIGAENTGKWGGHFWPSNFPGFFGEVALSVACVGIWAGLLLAACIVTSFRAMFVVYFAPLTVFASWLVITTFLHHNDEDGVAWFSGEEWDYVRGNLSSIDRSFGPFLDEITHNIATHQVHHLFPIIPHYHLKEATEAFRRNFGDLVRTSDVPILPAFLTQSKTFTKRRIIGNDDKVVVL